jgi:DNA-binding CsgD family transcriptional regulator
MRYQNQEKEKSLKATIQRAEQVKRYNILLTTFAGVIIILLVLSLYLVRQGNRKNVALKEEQLQNVRKELEIRQEQLITFTQQLADRSRVIQKLESQIQGEPISTFEPEDEHAFDHLLQMKILTDEDWRVFRLQFDQAFPGLMLRLHARYPFLTGAEQRIFLLIRLCSDTREIADLLGISTESVRKAKYRLKKKLGLSENIAIDDFIRKF